jgi:aconitate hydratase
MTLSADTLDSFAPAPGRTAKLHSLPRLERLGLGAIGRLPVCLRIILEALARSCDGRRVQDEDVAALAGWRPHGPRAAEVPFFVSRVLLQDFTGVPLIVDLAAMRGAAARAGADPRIIEPVVPVDLVVDHSIQVDAFGRRDALEVNLQAEIRRNRERYEFLKWGAQAFRGLRIVPPGVGICHQVNLELLARGVVERGDVYAPDTLVGTDSHTTMVNGIAVLGWGVGGIEAEAAILGEPLHVRLPDVVGVHLRGALAEGATATDLVLAVTERLRAAKVVGSFVEFHGEGAASLAAPERATIANMAPEYGATVGYFPPDEETCRYLLETGRPAEHVAAFRRYFEAQELFGAPRAGGCDYTRVLEIDLGEVGPSVAGPKRPQDRIALGDLARRFTELLGAPPPAGYGRTPDAARRRVRVHLGAPAPAVSGGGAQGGFGGGDGAERETNPLTEREMVNDHPTPDIVTASSFPRADVDIGDGDIAIAAITSCTNTSNPSVMLAAGLLAKKAVERGLAVAPSVKTSLAPGSRVVTDYLERAGLAPFLAQLGFATVGYGCTTCIGNSGPLDPEVEAAIARHGLVLAAVLSGNRNFEARIHASLRANFLMSPPLVVAFAIAGRVGIDLTREPLGTGKDGRPVFLREVWPSAREVAQAARAARDPAVYRRLYGEEALRNPLWAEIPSPAGLLHNWDPASTYIREPSYVEEDSAEIGEVRGARALAVFGDSVTTDHLSPAGAIPPDSPAGRYLAERGVPPADFNTYGARRGNHEVMVRGTLANVRLRNLLVPGSEGGVTRHEPDGARMTIFEAARRYAEEGVPLVIVAGEDYGMGSSRDWAAKGTRLLGVRAVIARSFERIHRANLVMMGVLPCELHDPLEVVGGETLDILRLEDAIVPGQELHLRVHRPGGAVTERRLVSRIDTPTEAAYYRGGGILPYVLARLNARPPRFAAPA